MVKCVRATSSHQRRALGDNIPPITYSALADFRSKGECGDGKKKLSGEGSERLKRGEPKTKRAILTLPKVRAAQAVVARRAINFAKV